MRKLIILNHGGLNHNLVSELQRPGVEIVKENWEPSAALLNRTLVCIIWFYEGLRSPLRVWRLSRLLRKHGVPLLAWNQDAPHYINRAPWRLDFYNFGRILDLYATHTLIDSRRSFADTVLYLPNAADISSYNLRGPESLVLPRLRNDDQYAYDVSFFGAMDASRYKELRPRHAFLTDLSKRLTDAGISHLFREAAGMSVDEQVRLIQSSRINLNFGASCDYGAPVASGLPERCFGIPAAGGFLLCDHRTHASDHFSAGVDWAEFDGLEDCTRKISYWLAHLAESRNIAERAYRKVMRFHTYQNRAETLHQALSDWHGGKRGLMR